MPNAKADGSHAADSDENLGERPCHAVTPFTIKTKALYDEPPNSAESFFEMGQYAGAPSDFLLSASSEGHE